MMYPKAIRDYEKELKTMKTKLRKKNDEYDILLERSGCLSCTKYFRRNVDNTKGRHINCKACEYYEIMSKCAEEIDLLSSNIDQLIENDFSKAVFVFFAKKKPKLIHVLNGEETEWDEAFGNEYEKVSKALRYSLVGLLTGEGRYKLK